MQIDIILENRLRWLTKRRAFVLQHLAVWGSRQMQLVPNRPPCTINGFTRQTEGRHHGQKYMLHPDCQNHQENSPNQMVCGEAM